MKISQILDKIDEKQLFVPAFQREYVWKRPDAKNLISSLIKDYPTNSIINLWANYEILIKEDRFHRFSSKSQKNYEKIESYWK